MPQARSWQEMSAQVQAQLERQTGENVAQWNARIKAEAKATKEPQLRRWLAERGIGLRLDGVKPEGRLEIAK